MDYIRWLTESIRFRSHTRLTQTRSAWVRHTSWNNEQSRQKRSDLPSASMMTVARRGKWTVRRIPNGPSVGCDRELRRQTRNALTGAHTITLFFFFLLHEIEFSPWPPGSASRMGAAEMEESSSQFFFVCSILIVEKLKNIVSVCYLYFVISLFFFLSIENLKNNNYTMRMAKYWSIDEKTNFRGAFNEPASFSARCAMHWETSRR